MKSMIKTFVLAILAMAFTVFPAVAADQTKQVQQVKKPQVQQVGKREPTKAEYDQAKNKRLPEWVGNMCGPAWGVPCKRRIVSPKDLF